MTSEILGDFGSRKSKLPRSYLGGVSGKHDGFGRSCEVQVLIQDIPKRNGREKSKACQARIFETETDTKTNTPSAVGVGYGNVSQLGRDYDVGRDSKRSFSLDEGSNPSVPFRSGFPPLYYSTTV